MRPAVRAVLVVVPARDERELLGACLDAIEVAAARVPLQVLTVVVLDRCTDGTAQVLVGRPALALPSTAGCVGAARAAGVQAGLRGLPDVPPAAVWVASTDADSSVDPGWLEHQVALADEGADLVLGTVRLAAGSVPREVALGWADRYHPVDGHDHVHGANLGVRGSAYLRAGGFPPLAVHEDVALALAVTRTAGSRVVRTAATPVTTSGRLQARAPAGFASYLGGLGDLGSRVG